MKYIKTFENFSPINEEEEGNLGKFLGTDKEGNFMDKLENLKGKGFKVYTKVHKTEEDMIEFARSHKFKGELKFSPNTPEGKVYFFVPEEKISRGSATSAGLNTGAGGMGYSKK
jgi:ribosomal protein S24E